MLNNSPNVVLTLGTTTSMANIATKGVLMKEKPTSIFQDSKFFVLIAKSSFSDLCDSFDKNDLSFLNVVVLAFVNS